MPRNLALTGVLLPGSRAEISAELLDDFPAMVWVADATLQIVFVNRAWIAFTGRSIAVERGDAWKDGLFAPDREHVAGAIAAAMAERRSFSCEFRLRHQNGLHRWVCARGAPRVNAHGEFVGYVAYCEEKKLDEVQERFVRISETTSDFVGMAAVNGDVLYMNRAGRQLLGWPLDGPLNGRKFSDVHPAWANEIVMHAAIPAAIREGTWAGETALLAADGREIPVSQVLISHAGADGTIEFLSTIIRDISDRKREEVARIEWANRYDAAIRASGQLLFDWNSFTNDITYAGDIESMFGYSMREMAGGLERFRQLIHPADLVAFDEEVSRVTASRDPFHLRFRVVKKQGNAIDIEAKGYFFLDRQGHIGRMVGFFADVTAQVRAQEEIALAHDNLEMRVAERTAELARTYVVIQDRALQQESVAHLGQRALAGAPLEELFTEAAALVQSTLKVALCSVLELAADRAELIVRGTAGWPVSATGKRVPAGKLSQSGYTVLVQEPVIVENMALETRFTVSQPVLEAGAVSGISVVIQADGAPMGVLCALTRERRSFTVDDVYFLRSITNILTAAIERRAAEENIRAAKAQAEAANRAKSEFLSRMSHELRTPLNAILGFTQLLEIDDPSASQGESISHISRAGQHLLSLINEVLDIARIESGRLALAPEAIDVGEIVGGAVDLIRPLAARHAIELGMDQSCCSVPQVFADRQRLRQVLLNLLSNAVKYNRQAGKVAVSAVQMAGDRLRIKVRDTGHGIPPDKIARLFVPFERLGAEAGDIEGTGIGLALSQRIMNAMGGTIGVESVVDEGTTFWIELARMELSAPENADANVSPGSEGNAFPGRTILYVEGQDLNVRLMEGMLSRLPEFRLLSAMQGGLAFDLAREHRPDLILLDLELPDMSGNEVLRRLKSDQALKHIPVVMVSEDATTEVIDTLLNRGAHGHLAKPYRVDEFFRVLEEVLPS